MNMNMQLFMIILLENVLNFLLIYLNVSMLIFYNFLFI